MANENKNDVPSYEDTHPLLTPTSHLTAEVSPLDAPEYDATHPILPNNFVPPHQYSGVESFGKGAAQGATIGYADEGEGALKALLAKAENENGTLGDLYRRYRDESRGEYTAAKTANPGHYMGGQVLGGTATLAIPGANAVELGGAGSALLGSAALGGISGLGNSEADLTSGNPKDLAKAENDVAMGTGLGAGLGLFGYGVTKALPSSIEHGTKALYEAGETAAQNPERALIGEAAGVKINNDIKAASDLLTDTGKALKAKFGKEVGAARDAVTSVDSEKYTSFLDDQLGKIDKFVASRKGETLDDFPELQKMRDYLDRLRNGKTVEEDVPVEQIVQRPGKPSTVARLQKEASTLGEQSKLSGENSTYEVLETTGQDGKKYVSLIRRSRDVSNSQPEIIHQAPAVDPNAPMDINLENTGLPSVNDGLKVKTLPSEPEVPPTQEVKQTTDTIQKKIDPNLVPSGNDIYSQIKEMLGRKAGVGGVPEMEGYVGNVLKNEMSPGAQETALDVGQSFKPFENEVNPALAQAKDKYKGLMDLDRLVGKTTKGGDNTLSGQSDQIENLDDVTKVRNFLENLNKDSQTGRRSSELMEEELEPKMQSYIQDLRDQAAKTTDPNEAAQITEHADNLEEFLSKGKDASLDYANKQALTHAGTMGYKGMAAKYGAYGLGKAMGTDVAGVPVFKAGAKLGGKILEASPQIAPGVLNEPKTKRIPPTQESHDSIPAKTSQVIYHMDDNDLLAKIPDIQSVKPEVAKKLMEAIATKNDASKRAMQFVIAQDPNLRDIFKT